jgi:Mn-dependent DtxR family transcriptional regulator
MSDKRKRELMDNLDRCYKVVLQSSSKGISAVGIASELGVHRTTVHNYLNTLELMGKVYSEHGFWYAKKGERGVKPEESEITIELPMSKDVWMEIALLEVEAKRLEKNKLHQSAELIRTLLEKLRETRTITIKGKNVDSLDLEKLHGLILEAYEKGSKVKSRNLSKYLRGIKNGSG